MKETIFTLSLIVLFCLCNSCDHQTHEKSNSLKLLADTSAAHENWPKTAQLYNQAIKAEKESFSPRKDFLYKAYYGLASSKIQLNSLDSALESSLAAYDLANSIYTPSDTELVDVTYLVGAIYLYRGEFTESIIYQRQCLTNCVSSYGKSHSNYGAVLNNLAYLHDQLSQYEKALPLYLEAIENVKTNYGKDHPEYAIKLNNLAALFIGMGQYEKALPLCLEALEIREKELGKDHRDYGSSLNNLASLYGSVGQYDKALYLQLEALENAESSLGKNHIEYAACESNLAFLYETIGQYEKALSLYLEALERQKKNLGKKHLDYSNSLSNLAILYESMGQYDKALPLQLESVENTENRLGKEHSLYGTRLNNLAHLYQSMGQYEKALPLYLTALENTEKSLGKDNPNYGIRLNNLATLYKEMGQYDRALPLYLEALKNTEKSLGKNHPAYRNKVNKLAALYKSNGQYDKALPLYLEGEANAFGQLDQLFAFMSETEKANFLNTVSKNFDEYLSFYIDYSRDNKSISKEAYNTELALKGLILNSGIRVRESILSSGDSAAIATYEEWELQRTLIAKQYALPIADRRSDFAELEENTNQLEADLTRMSAAFGDQIQTGSIKWTDIQSTLDPGTASIEFSTFDYYDKDGPTDSVYYYAHILLPEADYPISVFLFEEGELGKFLTKTNERNREYVQRIYGSTERGANASRPEEAVNLAKLIWEPLAPLLEELDKVYFAPSGLLHRLNLNAIEIDTYTTISDKVELVQLGSTGDLLSEIKTTTIPKEVVLYGGLKYTEENIEVNEIARREETRSNQEKIQINVFSSRRSWGDLPYTLKEVETIASILEESEINYSLYSGEAGTEESFLTLVEENKDLNVIHFATHGYFFERDTTSLNLFMRSPNPLFRSGLIMSNANQAWIEGHFEEGQEDGVLTAYEISQLNFRETELVVLSACETGLGDISNSEGVYGLQRAFKLAGVDYIIMTLWQVPDKQSKVMMEKFYRNWIERGQSIPEAFRNAQKEMRELFDTYEWGGFVLVQ